MNFWPILNRTIDGRRLSREEAVQLFSCDALPLLGSAAHRVRLRIHPDPVVTYIPERNINYTNICRTRCDFCSFYARPGRGNSYVISREELHGKLRELVEQGGRQILMQGGIHPGLPLEWFEELLRDIKASFPVHIHAFSPPEISWLARKSGSSIHTVIERLRAAGLDSIPGGGAEILVDRVREAISPRKIRTDEWFDVMRAANACGLRGTATMMYGHQETYAERVEHLERVRAFQDETGFFTAFICWNYQKGPSAALDCATTGAHDYLRTVAISRLFLDNVPNLQASWVTQGAKVGQLALLFGCNDMGGTMMEENVVSAAGTSFCMDAREIERVIREAGFEAARRDFFYRPVE